MRSLIGSKFACIQKSKFRIKCFPRFIFYLDKKEPTDCVLIVGISRPKFVTLLLVTIVSISVTFFLLLLHNDINLFANRFESHDREKIFCKRLPQALIIGTRKGGTGALLEMLNLHPNIRKASKEIHFFDRDDIYNGLGLDWYREQMPKTYPNQITIEKTPGYFVSPEVPERIKAMNSSIKLLLIVREPLTRTISDYTQLLSNAPATVQKPQQQPQQYTFEKLALFANGSVNRFYRPIATSIYHQYLYKWFDLFAREQILVVDGEVLIENPLDEIRKIERFLHLRPAISTDNFYFNQTKGFYCLKNTNMRWCLRNTKGRKHARINPLLATKIRKFFRAHNELFYELINETFNWPNE